MIKVKEVDAKSIVTKSKLPDADFVINPYIGCPHKCMYCYAEFMKRFSNHEEAWGDFLDIKSSKPINIKNLKEKKILISSVTDPYNGFEGKYKKTQRILNALKTSGAYIDILTKSSLVCRDIELLKGIDNIAIGVSINTLDDDFRKDIEPYASSVQARINTLKKLKENKIKTYAFIGPIFPNITDIELLINELSPFVDLFCFENLNLRGKYKKRVLNYIREKHSNKIRVYEDIYEKKSLQYWSELEKDIKNICEEKKVAYKIYFYHEKIKK